jgi:ketosteroid isomerase-like protein
MVDLYQQQRNRLIVARYWEQLWTNSNLSVVDELYSDDFVQFYPMHGRLVGRNAVNDMMVGFKEMREYLGMKTFPVVA